MKKIAWLFIIFAAALFAWGCGPKLPNQVCAIKADTFYYNYLQNPKTGLYYWSKSPNGLKSGQRILVTWKTGFNDSENLVSCMLQGEAGDFLSGSEIYVPKRNIDFENKQPSAKAEPVKELKKLNKSN